MDPRIADDQEAFVFRLANLNINSEVNWYVDGKLAATTPGAEYLWPLQRGAHSVKARFAHDATGRFQETSAVRFMVK